ncbi:MAG: two-component regulator propeller domain-containing protein [Candidatus Solibacter sp.]
MNTETGAIMVGRTATIRHSTCPKLGLPVVLLLCTTAAAAEPRPSTRPAGLTGDHLTDIRFAHLTTNDGLSQSTVTEILQDRRGFMWFATRDGLNRYDGNAFVVYKHNPNDPSSLSANFVLDLMEDDQGHLWIATNFGGVDKFNPATKHFDHYRNDPNNPNSISGNSVESIARDRGGHLWFGTNGNGLDKFDPSTGTFTHYLNDSDGQFVGRITKVIAGRQGEIWFVGERGLFYLNPEAGRITRPPATVTSGLAADYVYEDDDGNLWMLAWSPVVGLVKYDRHAERLTKYPIGAGAVGVASSNFLADGQNGFWVSSSQGLYYFDRRTERFTDRFQHNDTSSSSLADNTVVAIYQDKGGVVWLGTGNGLNLVSLRQQQFRHYRHLPFASKSLSPGKVTAIYEEPNDVLWVGFLPRALDRVNRKTGEVNHYAPDPKNKDALSTGMNVAGIYKDARGYLWLGGWGAGLDRFDERTGQFKHYRYNPDNLNSLISDGVYNIYGNRGGYIWVGQLYGLSRLDPAADQFTSYRPDPRKPSWNGSSVSAIYQDRSGTLWLGTTGGALILVNDKLETLVDHPPDPRDPHKLNGGAITAILEDRAGTLWVGSWDGLYQYNRQTGIFTRYTERQGLPSSVILGILEDKEGRLWLSTKKGISRFDLKAEVFRNYDMSDGLQSDEFNQGSYFQGPDGEMFFGGSNGFNAFFPETVRDNPYVPPVVITTFRIFNQPVAVGPNSVLKKDILYVDSLTLPYGDNVFSFEFAALSYANSSKNRYRYKLESFEPNWNEVSSSQRLAIYTNLDPGRYVFRVQGSNSDGVWNREGVSLSVLIAPPWWKTGWFRALCAGVLITMLWVAYQFNLRQLRHEFNMASEARQNERLRVARELHDTLLQSFQASLIQMQAARNIFDRRPEKAVQSLDDAIRAAAGAVAEGRDAIQDLRAQPIHGGDLPQLLTAAGQELAHSAEAPGKPPAFRVTVEGERQDLELVLQDEVYRIGRELLRNAFRHAQAGRIEVEIRYESRHLSVHVRDDGRGIDPKILQAGGRTGHFGLPGIRERVNRFGGKLELWSESGAGTEARLIVPAAAAYANSNGGAFSFLRRKKA